MSNWAVILGASNIDQLKENIASQALVERLDDDLMNKIAIILQESNAM